MNIHTYTLQLNEKYPYPQWLKHWLYSLDLSPAWHPPDPVCPKPCSHHICCLHAGYLYAEWHALILEFLSRAKIRNIRPRGRRHMCVCFNNMPHVCCCVPGCSYCSDCNTNWLNYICQMLSCVKNNVHTHTHTHNFMHYTFNVHNHHGFATCTIVCVSPHFLWSCCWLS